MNENLGQRPLSSKDVEILAERLRDLGPARLQEAELWGDDKLALGFYSDGLIWIVFDLNARAPGFDVLAQRPALKQKPRPKPLTLFMRSHFIGHTLAQVEAPPDLGRVLYFRFTKTQMNDLQMPGLPPERQPEHQIEIRLFPRGANAIAKADGKSVALHKPLPLKTMVGEEPAAVAYQSDAQTVSPLKRASQPKKEPGHFKRLQQLERALDKVTDELAKKRDLIWQQAGEWLSSAQTLKGAPAELASCIDSNQSFSWNLNRCFEKAKQLRGKTAGTQVRRDSLALQINALKEKIASGQIDDESAKLGVTAGSKSEKSLLALAKSQGRTFELGGATLFFVGKSAEDNLRLLRAARPWHLWLHLKDYPGSHGILQRNKNQNINDAILHEAAHNLLKVQFGDKASRHNGDKFAILVAECRHVRPIKGDRLGRVNYSDERTFVHQFVK